MKTFPLVISFISFVLMVQVASGQEFLMGLSSARMPEATKGIDTVILGLPFFDDFSDYEGYPDARRWLSTQPFVGKNYARQAPTVGMVTLDALDANGDLYPQASTNPFTADTLTSQIIRLDSLLGANRRMLLPSDSVVLSFFYLPGGWYGNPLDRVGSVPSAGDSLLLEFYESDAGRWNLVWSSAGYDADTTGVGSHWPWRFASVKIDSVKYLTSRFQFRFRNYASLDDNPKSGIAGNCDQWNLDYIYLNSGRSMGDSLFRDVAFVEKAPSMLSQYQAMPFRQFANSDMAQKLDVKIVNRYNQTLASSYNYHVYDDGGTEVGSYDGGYENVPAFFPSGQYQNMPVHAAPPVTLVFPAMSRPTNYRVVHVVREGVNGDSRQCNDTIVFDQCFGDYYAYDDGTPENGYGVTKSGPTSNKMWIALEFDLRNVDTLTAVDIFFNRTRGGENEQIPFRLCIWNCHNRLPFALLYSDSERRTPQFDGLNKYHRYRLERPVVVSDSIFVGFEQLTTDFINLGFDRNTDSRKKTFYRVGNDWNQSIWAGSIMMRPCFGQSALVGMGEIEDDSQNMEVEMFPNPAVGSVNLRCLSSGHNHCEVTITDIRGRIVKNMSFSETISLHGISSGIYFVRVSDKQTGHFVVKKLIVAK